MGTLSKQLAQQQVRPWMSPAVFDLSKRSGSKSSDGADKHNNQLAIVQPMVVEGGLLSPSLSLAHARLLARSLSHASNAIYPHTSLICPLWLFI